MHTIQNRPELIIRLLRQSLIIHRITTGIHRLGFISDQTYDEMLELAFELMTADQVRYRDNISNRFFRTYNHFLAGVDTNRLDDVAYLTQNASDLYCQLKMIVLLSVDDDQDEAP
ncbi:MAG: hypothetical protein HC859_16165 [Bacteroidia bacterium]|nr:hypothetical protein [Bacteroidia bacterium]